jgi:hypothetical protein
MRTAKPSGIANAPAPTRQPQFLSELPAGQALALLQIADTPAARAALARWFWTPIAGHNGNGDEHRLGVVMLGLAERAGGAFRLTPRGWRWLELAVGR